jgi:NADH:ubiquinone oxidoreductase subunit D/NADH:ubiquinone oxidoreductase subunit C
MGDLVRSVGIEGDDLVRAEGIPDILGEALSSLKEVVGLSELVSITVVDRTDMGEGLELVHHIGQQGGGALLELRTPYPQGEGAVTQAQAPSATPLWRGANWLEREAWEMSGVAFEVHDDLRRLLLPRWWSGHPLRRDEVRQRTIVPGPDVVTPGSARSKMEHWYPVDLPLAPMGGRCDLSVRTKKGRVTGARVSVGALHRGIEGLCEGRSYNGVLPLAARTAVRSSIHWQVAFSEAVEALCGLEVPPRATSLRIALMELERMADHMLAHAATLDIVGCRAASSSVWADRELVLDAAQAISGQRLVQDAIVIGGVAHDASSGWSDRAQLLASTVQAAVHRYVEEAEVLHPLRRLEGLATVHLEDMSGFGLSGPLLRGAGVARDARMDGRSPAYRNVEVPIATRDAGDGMARTEVRLLEIASSAKVLAHVVRGLPGGRIRSTPPTIYPKGSGVAIVEDPRGELLCHVVSDGTDRPRRVRFRSPDMAHAAAVGELLLGCPEDDVALAVASTDICVGGVDR